MTNSEPIPGSRETFNPDTLVIHPDNPESRNILAEFYKPPYNWLFHTTWRDSFSRILTSGELQTGAFFELYDPHGISKPLSLYYTFTGVPLQISWNLSSAEVVVSQDTATFGFLIPLRRTLELNPFAKLTPARRCARNELQLINREFNISQEIAEQTPAIRNKIFKSLRMELNQNNPHIQAMRSVGVPRYEFNLPSVPIEEMILVLDKNSWEIHVHGLVTQSQRKPKGVLLVPPLPQDSSFRERTINSNIMTSHITEQLRSLDIPPGQISYSELIGDEQANTSWILYSTPNVNPPSAIILDNDEVRIIQQ